MTHQADPIKGVREEVAAMEREEWAQEYTEKIGGIKALLAQVAEMEQMVQALHLVAGREDGDAPATARTQVIQVTLEVVVKQSQKRGLAFSDALCHAERAVKAVGLNRSGEWKYCGWQRIDDHIIIVRFRREGPDKS